MYEVAIAGGGAMGLATAYALLKRGVRNLVVLERDTVGNDRAASTDTTKAIRYEYANSELYSLMVGRSIELWRDLEAATGTELYVNSGVVCWGQEDAEHARESFLTLSRLGSPIREISTEELCTRYPQFAPADITYATYNLDGGFLRASRCVAAFASEVRRLGGEIRENAALTDMETGADGVTFTLANGEKVRAAKAVLAAGAWSATLFPRLGLRLPLTANKQQVVYMAGLGPEFVPGTFPVYLNLGHSFYGFPLDEKGLLKASIHYPGPIMDPEVPEPPDDDYTQSVVEQIHKYMPAARQGRVVLARVCMYAMSPDEHFYLDHFPGDDRIVLGAGFSGHGFKFAPLIGEMLGALLLGEQPEFPVGKFAVTRFGEGVPAV